MNEGKFGLPDSLIDRFIKKIVLTGCPNRIILFGSRARGNPKKNSDIDLAISGAQSFFSMNEILNEEMPTLLKFDVINFDEIKGSFKNEIVKEGIVLYEKSGTTFPGTRRST